jgi:hypothetical protein
MLEPAKTKSLERKSALLTADFSFAVLGVRMWHMREQLP